jgi:hypothetical protein
MHSGPAEQFSFGLLDELRSPALTPKTLHSLFQTTGECNPVTYRWKAAICVSILT